MDKTAFELRSDYAGTVDQVDEEGSDPTEVPLFQGGVVALDGRHFDVGEELEKGDGRIVVPSANQGLVDLLRAYPALKEVPVGDDDATVVAYELQSTAQLRDELRRRNLKLGGSKDELVARLTAQDEAIAAGDLETATTNPTPENAGDATQEG